MRLFFIYLCAILFTNVLSAQDRLHQIIHLEWNELEQKWKNSFVENRIYNDKNVLETRNVSYWHGTQNQWIPYRRFENTFDEKTGFVDEVKRVDLGNSKEQEAFKLTHSYDVFNRNFENILSEFNTEYNSWKNTTRTYYLYDSKNRIVVATDFDVIKQPNTYKEKNRRVYEYLADSKTNCYYDYEWNNETNFWKEKSKLAYTYDAKGNIDATYTFTFDFKLKNYVNAEENKQYYNDKSQQIQSINSQWNSSENKWIPKTKTDFTYYEDGLTYELVNATYDETTKKWKPTSKSVFLYERTVKPLPNKDLPKITLYPNPTKSMVHFKTDAQDIKEIYVFDMFGKQQFFSNKIESFQLPNAKPGVYFVSFLLQNNQSVVEKLTISE